MPRLLPHALFLALSPALLSPALAAPAQTLSAYAEQLLDEQGIKKDGPGLTLLVAKGDQLLYQGARGMASVELGVPLKPDHRMRLGSITKQFAAATLLKLIDEGKASLDDPLSKFLPDYPNGHAITLGAAAQSQLGCQELHRCQWLYGQPRSGPIEHGRTRQGVQGSAGGLRAGSAVPLQQQRLCAGGCGDRGHCTPALASDLWMPGCSSPSAWTFAIPASRP